MDVLTCLILGLSVIVLVDVVRTATRLEKLPWKKLQESALAQERGKLADEIEIAVQRRTEERLARRLEELGFKDARDRS